MNQEKIFSVILRSNDEQNLDNLEDDSRENSRSRIAVLQITVKKIHEYIHQS